MSKEREILLKINKISKQYQLSNRNDEQTTFHALQNISFDVKRGENIGLIGKNGSGKSTLLKIILGLIKPSSGTLTVQGKINSLIEIGSNFIMDLSGLENVKLFLKLNEIKASQHAELIEKIYDFAEIGDYFYEPVKYYSSGMYIRLAVAAAFHVNADIFLIDEVFMAGDLSFRNKIAQFFNKADKQNLSLLMASHNSLEIERNCDKVLWLNEGKIMFYGDVYEGIEQYNASLLLENEKDENTGLSYSNSFPSFDQVPQELSSNDFIEVIKLEILGKEGRALFKEKSICFSLSARKKTADKIHPIFKLYDKNLNPLSVLVSSNNAELYEQLNKTNQSLITLECVFPANLLSEGFYFLELLASVNPIKNEQKVRSFKLGFKLQFEVKSNEFDFSKANQKVYFKPSCEWKLN